METIENDVGTGLNLTLEDALILCHSWTPDKNINIIKNKPYVKIQLNNISREEMVLNIIEAINKNNTEIEAACEKINNSSVDKLEGGLIYYTALYTKFKILFRKNKKEVFKLWLTGEDIFFLRVLDNINDAVVKKMNKEYIKSQIDNLSREEMLETLITNSSYLKKVDDKEENIYKHYTDEKMRFKFVQIGAISFVDRYRFKFPILFKTPMDDLI